MAQSLETKTVMPDAGSESGGDRKAKAASAPAMAPDGGRQGPHGDGAFAEGAAAWQAARAAAEGPQHRGEGESIQPPEAAGGGRTVLEEIAAQFDRFGQQMAQAMQQGTADLHDAMRPPPDAAETLRDLQDGMVGMVNGVLQSNLRLTQALLQMAGPAAVLDAQHRFLRDYGDALLHGGSALVQVTRRTADRTLQPIQHRIDRMRRNGPDRTPTVGDVMSADVHVVTPEDTVQQATRLMRDDDIGVLPVGEGDRLIGLVTARDVARRVVAEGRDPQRTKVREVMSADPGYVFDDAALEQAASDMAARQARHIPVVNRNRRVVGMVSAADLARGRRSGPAREMPRAAE